MAHPHNEHRQHHVEKSRVHHLTKGYAKGGAVKHSDEKEDRKLIKSMIGKALHADGAKSKHRMDRPHRAKGGRVGKKGSAKTIVNVITGHSGTGMPPAPPMAPPAPPMGIAPAAMPPARPPMPGPGMPPPGAGGPPGGPPMPMRAKGGRVQTPTGSGVAEDSGTSRKTGGSPVFNASTRNGTQVSHTNGKSDGKDIGRGRVVTFKSGGRVRHFYAKGGRVESPEGVSKASKLPGGGGGGEARLAKAHRAARVYHGPAK